MKTAQWIASLAFAKLEHGEKVLQEDLFVSLSKLSLLERMKQHLLILELAFLTMEALLLNLAQRLML